MQQKPAADDEITGCKSAKVNPDTIKPSTAGHDQNVVTKICKILILYNENGIYIKVNNNQTSKTLLHIILTA